MLLRWSRRALVLLGLVLCLVFAGLLLFDVVGGSERLIKSGLARIFENEPAIETEVLNVRIDWLKPAFHIEGLRIKGAGGELFLEDVSCTFDLSHGGGAAARVAALDITRGRVVLSQAFTETMSRAASHTLEMLRGKRAELDLRPDLQKPRRGLPVCNLKDIEVALRLPTEELVELGTGAARLEDKGKSGLSLIGTIEIASGETGVQPLFIHTALAPSGELQIRAATRNLRLRSRDGNLRYLLPPAFQGADLDLRASVDFEGTLATDGSRPPKATARVHLEDGYLRPGPSMPALEEVEIDGQLNWLADLTPQSPEDLWRSAIGRGTFTARLVGEAIEGSVDLPRGGQVELAISAPNMTLDERLLIELGLPEDGPVRSNWRAFDFTGRADVDMGLRLDLTQAVGSSLGLELCLAASSDGLSSFRYNGFEVPGLGREGVPLACDQVGGRAVLGLRGGRPRPALFGIIDVYGSHGTGEFQSSGLIASPDPSIKQPDRTWAEKAPDLDLYISLQDRALNGELADALDGMRGTRWIWDAFNPKGGYCDALVALRSRPKLSGLIALIDVQARDTDMRWANLPVGLHIDQFDLQLRWSKAVGHGPNGWEWRGSGGRFEASGSSASVDTLSIKGMVRTTNDAGPVQVTESQSMHSIKVEAPGLALRGRDWDELIAAIPELAPIGQDLGTKGRVNLTWTDSSTAPSGAREVSMQLTPDIVELLPKGFPMVTQEVLGRLVLSARVPFAQAFGTAARGSYQAVLSGLWAKNMRVTATLDQPLDRTPGMLKFAAAGLDPSNGALLGAIASGPNGESEARSNSTEGVSLDGRFDLSGKIKLVERDQQAPVDAKINLRGNTLSIDGFKLDELSGTVSIDKGVLTAPRVRAKLAGTPVELTDARFAFSPATDQGATFFFAKLSSNDLPLGRKELSGVFTEEALDALFDKFGWHGSVDLDELAISLDRKPDGRLAMRLTGSLVPGALHILFGAPIEVSTAEVELEEFVLEGGHARAWGRVKGLFGAIAGREIKRGELLFSYVDQRLTIQALDSSFAGGQLRSLGGSSATALAVDLAPPHHFSVGIELKGVDAGSLLEGAFGGTETNSGLIDSAVRFEATPGDLLAANGAGWLRVRKAQLWSIPVFRELFKQLGFDATGIFDSMRANFAIQNGAFELRNMRAHSPLLKLVGNGQLDMNGDITSDFEVRYGLIDKLGPLSFFVYWLQNSILRVQVRGDLHRPVVLLRNSFFDIFKRSYKNKPRLPLPYPSSLPDRF